MTRRGAARARSAFAALVLAAALTPAPALAQEAAPPLPTIVPGGFVAQLVHAVDPEREGSWVSLAADERGRLYASDQYGGLFRITPPRLDASDARAHVEPVDVPLGEAHGLLFAHGALYVVVCGSGERATGLYRVTDAEGDDALDRVETLATFEGEGEHGPHAVVLDPDGEHLWLVAGNHTPLPERARRSRVPRHWGEDRLRPERPDPNGHAVGLRAPGGWIVRMDRDGGDWELFACGLRNAYDLAFAPDGELFTFDSDMEWDVGLPWYRPTRILHVVSGADFGWRTGSAKWPEHVLDAVPGVVPVGLTSPTGIAFGTGAAFPARWRDALFAADWAYGTIYAVHLQPDGASFTGSVEPFARGEPFPVTDLVVAADGALYVATGGRRAQSALYRIVWRGDEDALDAPGAARVTDAADAAALVARRRALEAWHGPAARGGSAIVDDLWPDLGHADAFVRHAARIALEHRDARLWSARALAEPDPARACAALLALARAGDATHAEPLWARLASIDPAPLGTREQRDLLRVIEVAWVRHGPPPESARAAWIARLMPRLPGGDEATDRALVGVLAALDAPGLPHAAAARLGATPQADAVIHDADALTMLAPVGEYAGGGGARVGDGGDRDAGGGDRAAGADAEAREAWIARLDAVLAQEGGGLSFARYVGAIRDELVAALPAARRDALSATAGTGARAAAGEALPASPAAVAPLGAAVAAGTVAPPPRAFVRHWTLDDLVPALPEMERGRDPARGRAAWRVARCDTCHRLGDDPGSALDQGPDLTGAGQRFTARDLLVAIVEPSHTISDQYQDTRLELASGEVVVGRIEHEDHEVVRVRTAAPGARLVELAVAAIVARRASDVSRMPEALVDGLEREELLDLVAWVRSGGDPLHAAFGE